MAYDNSNVKPPIVDLLYPSEEQRRACLKRKAQIEQLPTEFEKDLMLAQLSEQLTPHNQYKMTAILGELCDDISVAEYRLDIIDDLLADSALTATLRKVVDKMLVNDRTNIYKLTTPDSFTVLDTALTAFESYCECMKILHKLYEEKSSGIRSAGLKKLFDFFEGHYNSKHYKKLKAESEELRNAMTGKIRSATIGINFDENLVPISMGLVGFSDKMYEDSGTVIDRILSFGSKNNDHKVMRDLHERFDDPQSAKREEIVNNLDRALFAELDKVTKKYVNSIDDILNEYRAIGFEDMYAIEYQLDFYSGAVMMIENVRSKGLEMCRPTLLPKVQRKADIKGLFDPIYFKEANVWNLSNKPQKQVVTNDITFDENAGFYLLTGANNGGKTTFVRAVGICQVMAQAGLYVPASSCEISLVDCIYTHFPKEEQVGIDASRFTTEVKEFKAISDCITNHSLLLMNESIQSTTPQECTDIAAQLMRIFCIIGVRGIFATHLTPLAKAALELDSDPKLNTRAESITVTVDEATGERRYKIKKGLPGANSYASTIFEKYGLDIKALEKKAEKMNH